MPAELVGRYEAMIDQEDGRIAQGRLDSLDARTVKAVTADQVAQTLGL